MHMHAKKSHADPLKHTLPPVSFIEKFHPKFPPNTPSWKLDRQQNPEQSPVSRRVCITEKVCVTCVSP